MPEDTPGEEQRTMLSFAEAAERLVADGIAQSMTAEGLRKLARDPASGWPIGPDDYRVVGKTRMLPYELLVPYMQGRRRGRGPDKTKQRSAPPGRGGRAHEPRGASMSTAVDPRTAILSDLSDPPYNERSERHCVPWAVGERMLDAYRAAVLREAADRLEKDLQVGSAVYRAERELIAKLRRMADEAQTNTGE
jgi:hypothetical protein